MSTDMPETDKPLKRIGNPNWTKGVSGNPEGGRAVMNKPIALLARSHAPHALKTLVAISKDQQAPAAARVAASQAILDRAYGRAPTFSTQDPGQFKRAIDMTDDELAAIVAKASLTIVK